MISTRKLGIALALFLVISLTMPALSGFSFEYRVIRQAEVYAPAVTSSGAGVLSKITLIIAGPGTGRVFFSALPYTEVDTQGAARIAAEVAARIAGEDFSRWDYYIIMEAPSPIIGGPSAGGLMASAFLLLFMDKPPRNDTTMTGMINPDGLIGPVGGLKEKIEAAASQGFRMFLIPRGQRYYSYPVITEERVGVWIIRRITYETLDLVEYGRELNISVIEVGTLLEAASYLGGVAINSSSAEWSLPLNVSDASRLLMDEAASAIGDAYAYAKKMGASWWAAALINSIDKLNATLSSLGQLAASRPYYVFGKLLEVYGDAYKLKVYAGLLSGDLSPSEVVDELGKRLRDYSQSLGCSSDICEALARGYMAYAEFLYEQLLGLGNSTAGPSPLDIASYASLIMKLVMTARAIAIAEVPAGACSSLGNRTSVLGSALAIYSYISRLTSEMGLSQGYLSDADNLNSALMEGKAATEYEVYGASLLLIASSISGFATALGGNLANYLASQEKVLAYMLGRAAPSSLALLYYQIARESREMGEGELAERYMALSLVIALYAGSCGAPSANTPTGAAPPSAGPSNTETPWAGPAPTPSPSSSAPVSNAIYSLVLVLIVAALGAALIILIRPKR